MKKDWTTGFIVEKISVQGLRPGLKSLLPLLLVLALFASCKGETPEANNNQSQKEWTGKGNWLEMWGETPEQVGGFYPRLNVYNQIQKEADDCASVVFKKYLTAENILASSLQLTYPILSGYDLAFQKVLDGVRSTTPANGEVYIWHLYNMGYVVKSALGTFAIDIFHRRAEELAPYLDFYAITHQHTDHKWIPLAQKLGRGGVPVLANFEIAGCDGAYITNQTKDYVIKGHKIHTFITNHNNSSTNVDITVFKIDFGEAADGFVMIHSGDSNFRPEQFVTVKDAKVDLDIPRYAQTPQGENEVIGKVFNPKYTLLSHILELAHEDESSSRWPLSYGLKRAETLACPNTYMPFWGDLYRWKDGKLSYIKPQ